MNDNKWILKSKTVWGILLVAVPALLETAGISIPKEWIGDGDNIVKGIFEVVGMIVALYGRIAATGGVTLTPGK